MDKPYKNRSIFPPYPTRCVITASVSTIVARQLEGALTVGADLSGITSGDRSQLVDLTTTFSPLISYFLITNPDQTFTGGATTAGVPGTDVVALVNPAIISNILANQVSPHFDAGPCVNDHALVHDVSASFGWFDAGPPFGTGYGITMNADAAYYADTTEDNDGHFWPANALHIPASVAVYVKCVGIQPLQGNAYWALQIVNTSVSLPWWFPFFLMLPAIAMAIIAPVTIMISIAVEAALQGVVQGELNTIAGDILNLGQAALAAASLPSVQSVGVGSGVTANIDMWKYGFGSEGPEAQINISPVGPVPAGATLTFNGGTITGSGTIPITYRDELSLVVSVNSVFLDPFITWSVTRKDTNAVIVSRTTQFSDPGGSSLTVVRTTSGLQAVEEFLISVTIYVPGKVLSYQIDVPVLDWMSRRQPYVKWVSQTWFRDPSKPRQWRYYWERTRVARIHRTDFPGRCRRLSPPPDVLQMWLNNEAPDHIAQFKYLAQWIPESRTYLDSLPFANADAAVAGRHGVLCDYCFFGGPSKTELLVSIP